MNQNQDPNGRPLMRKIITDSTGVFSFDLDALAQTLTYGGPGGALDTVTVGPDSSGNNYRQTFTYSGTNVTGISAWIKL